jgi:hypothetical protein
MLITNMATARKFEVMSKTLTCFESLLVVITSTNESQNCNSY